MSRRPAARQESARRRGEPAADAAAAKPCEDRVLESPPTSEVAAPRAAPRRSPSRDWRTWLAGGSSKEVLARLVQGDPLELRAVVAERLRARAYLLPGDRVHLRSLARCARHALGYRGRPPLDAWLRDRVDEAVVDLLREDGQGPIEGEEAPPGELSYYRELAAPLGLDPAEMRGVCAAFNRLPEPDRAAFCALVIEGRPLEEVSEEAGASATEVARRARRALQVFLNREVTGPTSDPPAPGKAVS